MPALAREVVGEVAHEFVGGGDFDVDYGLEDDGGGLGEGVDDGFAPRRHERDFLRVHRVVFAIVYSDADVVHRVARDHAQIQSHAHALLHRGNEDVRNHAALHL